MAGDAEEDTGGILEVIGRPLAAIDERIEPHPGGATGRCHRDVDDLRIVQLRADAVAEPAQGRSGAVDRHFANEGPRRHMGGRITDAGRVGTILGKDETPVAACPRPEADVARRSGTAAERSCLVVRPAHRDHDSGAEPERLCPRGVELAPLLPGLKRGRAEELRRHAFWCEDLVAPGVRSDIEGHAPCRGCPISHRPVSELPKYIVFGRNGASGARPDVRELIPRPEQIAEAESDDRTRARDGDETLVAEAFTNGRGLLPRALIGPADRRCEGSSVFAEKYERVALGDESHRPDDQSGVPGRHGQFRDHAHEGAAPVIWIVFVPAGTRREHPVLGARAAVRGAVQRDEYGLGAARTQVDTDHGFGSGCSHRPLFSVSTCIGEFVGSLSSTRRRW